VRPYLPAYPSLGFRVLGGGISASIYPSLRFRVYVLGFWGGAYLPAYPRGSFGETATERVIKSRAVLKSPCAAESAALARRF
jgi:hypothetical protein